MNRTEKSIFSSVALALVDIVILVCTSFALYKSPVKTPEIPTIDELRFSIELLENESKQFFLYFNTSFPKNQGFCQKTQYFSHFPTSPSK